VLTRIDVTLLTAEVDAMKRLRQSTEEIISALER